ncbi:GNAT superfamily N-acetyltransferase [Rhodopseudomonas rhenobacensis]|uniref:GNAT superfamily N-acetyltransferase n=1 Tax=Rhodopseudomonas rhenobacensis TaxID=87461 RepID=A0A7W8DZ42_9BRAD|nr:GNAT family N-acetyltransferase [Rhodopseudomonas rhenobacensis]MBB5047432.1 GNAT superfamily N-acetyltransferase [Rhodopseudomonas rhenobacensis]
MPTLRRAGTDDADFIVGAILAAQRGHRSRGWFDIALNWPEPRCRALLRAIATHPITSCWHVSLFWIAEVEGTPAAALCALPSAGVGAATRAVLQQALRDAEIEPAEQSAIDQRGAYLRSCWMPGDDANWFIEHVATLPSYRGQGLMQALLAQALEEGAAAGHRRASITFYIGNAAAERCYAKAGFVAVEEKRHPEFERSTGATGFRRVERAI